MPCRVTTYEPTPNPNALKCVLSRALSERPRSFRNAAEAAGDPLAAGLFGVPGVTNILINGGWMTVGKSPQAAWPGVKAGVEAVLAALD
ncbi:MAG: NifU N-terminal domain-containing protein [Phycisphaerae bacterium]|nr:NifU N-terminal domain-containing protein [Phycisphaerae bacterium]